MSELRDEIAEKIHSEEYPWDYAVQTADIILSLIDSSPVEGLEVFRKCDCELNGKRIISTSDPILPNMTYVTTCMQCQGTGEIVRKMTRGEIEKVFKERIELEGVIELSTGERIRVEGTR